MQKIALNEVREKTIGYNTKFIFRHSIRPSLKGVEDSFSVGITKEGAVKANMFGNILPWTIGFVSVSLSKRCIQTAEEIIKGSKSQYVIIHKSSILTSPAIIDLELSKQSLHFEGNFKSIAYKLSKEQKIPGFSSIQIAAEKLLDYIFSVGNNSDVIDLFCTHDFNVILLILYLLPVISNKETIIHNWPNPLEGIFLWGQRCDFYFYWNGETHHFSKKQI